MIAPGAGRRRAVFVALAAGQVLVSLDASVLNVAIPQVAAGLDASGVQMQAIVVSYMVTFTALALPLAAWARRVGTNRVFMGGCVVFAAGSAASAASVTPLMLIVARSVQGVGAAGIASLALAILAANTPPDGLTRVTGMWASIAVASAAAGPLVGGVLVSTAGWRAVFAVNIPISLVVLVLAKRLLPPDAAADPAAIVDWPGAALLTAVLVLFCGGVAVTEAAPLTSTDVLVALGGAAVFGLLLAVQQRRSANPLLAWGVFARSPMPTAVSVMAILGIALSGALFVQSLFVQDVLGKSPAMAGMVTLGASVAIAVVSPLSGRYLGGLRPAVVVAAGLLLVGLSLGWMSRLGPGDPVLAVAAGLTVLGLGLAVAMPVVQAVCLSGGGDAGAPAASAAINLSGGVAAVLGITVMATLTSAVAQQNWTEAGGSAAWSTAVGAGNISGVAAAEGPAAAVSAADAFSAGVSSSLLAASVAVLAAAVLAFVALPRRTPAPTGPTDPAVAGCGVTS